MTTALARANFRTESLTNEGRRAAALRPGCSKTAQVPLLDVLLTWRTVTWTSSVRRLDGGGVLLGTQVSCA